MATEFNHHVPMDQNVFGHHSHGAIKKGCGDYYFLVATCMWQPKGFWLP